MYFSLCVWMCFFFWWNNIFKAHEDTHEFTHIFMYSYKLRHDGVLFAYKFGIVSLNIWNKTEEFKARDHSVGGTRHDCRSQCLVCFKNLRRHSSSSSQLSILLSFTFSLYLTPLGPIHIFYKTRYQRWYSITWTLPKIIDLFVVVRTISEEGVSTPQTRASIGPTAPCHCSSSLRQRVPLSLSLSLYDLNPHFKARLFLFLVYKN